ncbi:flagellar brake protein [Symbiobacterium terraclitae]|uniref:flagellar brake protein n=1 Tax=Symbiobacterium terraclitae TaxID=557451 RepID=UPI0035B51820
MRLPTINQRVTIFIPQGPWKGRYSTYMEAVDASTIRVAHPMFGSALVPLMPGDEVVVEYLEGGDRIGFEATVVQRANDATPGLILTRPEPSTIRSLQLRDFVRLDVSLPIEYVLSGTHREEGGKVQLKPGRLIDLSGGGAQIVTEEEFPVGTRLDLVIHLPKQLIPAEAEVVRRATDSEGPVRLGVRFSAIEERDREQIVKYIFAEQRRRRKKGLV